MTVPLAFSAAPQRRGEHGAPSVAVGRAGREVLGDLTSLEQGQVHLWCTSLGVATDSDDEILSEDERSRRQRFRTPTLQHDFLVSHVLVRRSLSRYWSLSPAAWRFRTNPHGRPEIDGPAGVPPLRFNLSHTDGLAVCAVALGRDLGVDVEALEQPDEVIRIAEEMFSDREIAKLRSLPAAARAWDFFASWTLREAYAKARGIGLSLPMRDVHFDVGEADQVRVAFAQPTDDADRWQFRLLRPTPSHLVAVCVARGADHLDIALRWLDM